MICQIKIVDKITGKTSIEKKFFSDDFDAAKYIEEYLGWPISRHEVLAEIELACREKKENLEVSANMRIAKVKFHEH